ncbi:benzoate-CoA ligase family protein [Actinokineospora sp. UTMC 2448]|uniref:benzoate-CoA ligase family protein n=1 Tax=Actinokineospora sp. UTMC 2448 TaxID=2268449 RepID=UPI002164515B|nr:benzoate-CoA ligase family protein [Actinokineospora sp. UTMC 2448]UVS78352.1 Benzoate--CoA ligase [Actinokineospora sp. UTMC 2448]
MDANIAARFLDAALDRGDGPRTALLTTDGPVTYAALTERANRLAGVLRALGVGQGDRVLLALSDGLDFVAAWFGAQRAGAVTAEVYTFLPAKDLAYFIGYTDATVVIVDSMTIDRVREAGTGGRRVLVADAGGRDLRDNEFDLDVLAEAATPEAETAPVGLDDEVLWKFTTGSTGRPKACVHTARSPLFSNLAYAQGVLALDRDDVVLPVPKLFFGYARDLAALFPFGAGGAGVVFPERTTPERVFDLIAEHRPTILVNVPTMMSAMVAHPSDQDLSCLRLCTSAGEALPRELHRKWMDRFGVEVVDGMGSSEAYHIFLSNRPGTPRPGTIGVPVPGYTARVVDPDGAEVPDGTVGALEVTGDSVALRYEGDPDKTALTFPAPGTVRTADLVTRGPDGAFTYRGRADDLLKVSGVWVAPAEIEHCLIGHPAVVECAVAGHDTDGLTRLWAYVVGDGVEGEELREYVRARLSPHKTPEKVVFLAELPRTANGKLDRRALP